MWCDTPRKQFSLLVSLEVDKGGQGWTRHAMGLVEIPPCAPRSAPSQARHRPVTALAHFSALHCGRTRKRMGSEIAPPSPLFAPVRCGTSLLFVDQTYFLRLLSLRCTVALLSRASPSRFCTNSRKKASGKPQAQAFCHHREIAMAAQPRQRGRPSTD